MGYTTLKAALDAVIKTNGGQEITGANLNGVMTTLLQGVDILDRSNPADTSGMNNVVLDKNKTFAEQVTATNTIYEIRDNFTLSADVAIPSNCYLYFNGGSVSGANLTGSVLNPVLRPEWFGAKGDGSTDDANAFYMCISLAISSGSRVALLQKNYAIKTSKKYTITKDVFIDGNGASLIISNNANLWFENVPYFSGNPSADIARKAGSVSFASLPSGIAEGDIIHLVSTEIGESSYNTTRQQVSRVGSISGTTIYLADNATLDFTAANTTITLYKPHVVGINNIHLVCNSGGNYHHLRVDHVSPLFYDVQISGHVSSYGIVLYGCVDGTIRNTIAMGVVYGYLANACAHLTFDGVHCPQIIQHPVAIAIFSNFITIKDMSGIGALIESHIAFNVEYDDCVFACSDSRTWAGRAVGFTMRNCKVWSYNGTKVQPVLISSVALYDRSIYLDYATKIIDCDLEMDELQIRESGLMEIKGCKFLPNTIFSVGGSGAYLIDEIRVYDCPNITAVRFWKNTFNIKTDREIFDAVLDNGVYTIDLGMSSVKMESGSGEWRGHGRISDVITAASVAYPIVLKPQRSNQANAGSSELYINFDFTIFSSNRAQTISYAMKKYRAVIAFFPLYAASKLLRLEDLTPDETLISATISDFSTSGTTSDPSAQQVLFTINAETTIPSASAARLSAVYDCHIVGESW